MTVNFNVNSSGSECQLDSTIQGSSREAKKRRS